MLTLPCLNITVLKWNLRVKPIISILITIGVQSQVFNGTKPALNLESEIQFQAFDVLCIMTLIGQRKYLNLKVNIADQNMSRP